MQDTLYQKLSQSSIQYTQLLEKLGSHDAIEDLAAFKQLSKECAKLKPVHECFERYRQAKKALIDNKALLEDAGADEELRSLALQEKTTLIATVESLTRTLEVMLMPEDPDDTRNVFLEIRAATGGTEASLFAGDLLRMYLRYAEEQQWKTESISEHATEQGGYKEVVVKVSGTLVYAHLKFESGTHRVQRIPVTETQGRVHTSTCTVAVLPVTEIVDDIQINSDDLHIDTFRASGAGGQHVQKTDSAVRIIHGPTGLVVECQDERSQHKNKERALSLLKARILARIREKQQQEEATARRTLVGTGKRAERIRTYNVPQGRLTDHRIPLTLYQLDSILRGQLSLIVDPLRQHDQQEQLKG